MNTRNRKLDVQEALPCFDITRNRRRGEVGTVAHLAEQLGLSPMSVRRHLNALHAENLARIGCWNRSRGQFVAVWIAGAGQHAPQPYRLSEAARARNYLARIRHAVERARRGFQYDERYRKQVALALADDVAQRSKISPQHWFSALGL